MRKSIALLLSVVMMIVALAGCASNSKGNQSNDQEPQGTTGEEKKADKVEKVDKVVMSFLAFVIPSEENTRAVEEAINAITRDSIGVEVDINIMDPASYTQQIPLMLSGGEHLDLFSGLGMSFSSMVNNGYALDLEQNDLIQTYGQGIIDTMGDYLNGCRVNGRLYGMPQNRDYAAPKGYAIVNEYLDKIGYTYNPNEVNKITEAELDDIFAHLHEAYPDKTVFVTQPAARTNIPCDYPGGDWYGVLMDPENSLTLTNLFETEEYFEQCNRLYKWNQLGYISPDALTDSAGSTTLIPSGAAMAYALGLKPGIILQESTSNGRAISIFSVEGQEEYILPSGSFADMPWMINSNTEVPEAAMKLMNEFYTNPVLENLLCYGIEDKDYVVDQDGFFTYPEGEDATTVYHPNVLPFMQNEFIVGVWKGDEADVWEKTKAFNDGAIKSLAMGFSFDSSSVSSELTALNNVYEEYRYQVEYGFLDPATGIAEMVSRMKNAGLDTYIAEKQKQLDQWAAANNITAN
ncbi:MAG TPA: ABC transporter substrate-binding protein [Clostridiales bacterium]|nr:ABC transporter substrate-binding protein [Clostridiales bacterium]